ncbi:ATPase subunit 8 (mitochondrion) [Dictyostelium discoideum]|uniref:ATPase subunit 8 n=1 Tax=Dictyostelium discoideum TaxID=44689 RepID=A9CLV7_DICDI|nr:ATPase subunit 8 [Dictyostelium discoideum]BAF95194.1 ATPase subunit 8 [Dictyostelium discoideum]|eukprot:YP_001604087.1 ATPase subunit 8 (mitochondrion) [Dictyostelium discoideum]
MPQLDFLIFFNEMCYTLVAFIMYYIWLYRSVIVKLAYNLKFRYKLSRAIKNDDNNNPDSKLPMGQVFFKNLDFITKYKQYNVYRNASLINNINLAIKQHFTNNGK